MRKRILFLIPNLKPGGAEKVLVNLVNNLDPEKYDITLQTLFDVGLHKETLKPHIHYRSVFPFLFRGNNTLFKLFPPKLLWTLMAKGRYDIAVSYLEGPTSRILSGCKDPNTKKVAWIHIEFKTPKAASVGFHSPIEAAKIYNGFDHIVAVSKNVKSCFCENLDIATPVSVLYNTNETEQIAEKAQELPQNTAFVTGGIPSVCSVARLMKNKGFDRLLEAHKHLLDEGLHHRIYILGMGDEQRALEQQIQRLGIGDTVILLGFDKNPYAYVARSDLYICSSRREGFSTAVTEALVVGTPVVSTDCSGAKELLGENDEYGLVVENSTEGIYQGLKRMLSDPALLAHYKEKAKERGSFFSRTETVKAVEAMLDAL